MRSSNPALGANTFTAQVTASASPMTLRGTVNKTFVLLFLTIATAAYAWINRIPVTSPIGLIGLIGGTVTCLVLCFKQEWAPALAPTYAILKGIFLGAISATLERQYSGIVGQAVMLTFGTFFAMLAAYSTGAIRPSENFKLGIVAATGGIFVVYLATIVLGMFGVQIPYIHQGGMIGIGFSLFVVVIAALNLVLDFDFIEQGCEVGAPKYMEWYAGFGLLVTLVWLYIEILRLLSKMRSR